jgi:hypothetical protein
VLKNGLPIAGFCRGRAGRDGSFACREILPAAQKRYARQGPPDRASAAAIASTRVRIAEFPSRLCQVVLGRLYCGLKKVSL